MASVKKEEFLSFDVWEYVVVSQYRNGYKILMNVDLIYKWCILNPDGSLTRFKTEAELWQYALKNKLFQKRMK